MRALLLPLLLHILSVNLVASLVRRQFHRDSTPWGFLCSVKGAYRLPSYHSIRYKHQDKDLGDPFSSLKTYLGVLKQEFCIAAHEEGAAVSPQNSLPERSAEDDTLAQLRRELRERHGTEFPLREHYIKGTGPGGQKVNKSANCVQLIQFSAALGTNVVVKCHMHRSLLDNRIEATRILLRKLDEAEEQQSRALRRLAEKEKRRILKLTPAEKARKKFEKQLRAEKKATRRRWKVDEDW
ncbi:peptide chain release factor [Babesia ovata]|uniref:Peptide chain release factor n=1 Tax=Babesia ovata TaxID=189622 RepID=A0A2H6K9M3_9APIC|nr:peptide chain release factor [Babesia ovata]GBE59696.1 peptide chain release factor [Babesia ovata]